MMPTSGSATKARARYLPASAHAHLHHHGLGVGLHAQQRKRHSHLVVLIARGGHHLAHATHHGLQQVFGAGLAGAAGYAEHQHPGSPSDLR